MLSAAYLAADKVSTGMSKAYSDLLIIFGIVILFGLLSLVKSVKRGDIGMALGSLAVVVIMVVAVAIGKRPDLGSAILTHFIG